MGRKEVSRIKFFISSMPRLDAASISITSVKEEREMLLQLEQ